MSDWLDEDDYPTDSALSRIEEWPWDDLAGLFEFMHSIWWAPDWGWTQEGDKYAISTGGWSGNEDVIGALQKNRMAWMLSWVSSRRGGHYEFELRAPPKQKEPGR